MRTRAASATIIAAAWCAEGPFVPFDLSLPPFRPGTSLLRGPTRRSIGSILSLGRSTALPRRPPHRVTLPDGGGSLHDDCPSVWRPGDQWCSCCMAWAAATQAHTYRGSPRGCEARRAPFAWTCGCRLGRGGRSLSWRTIGRPRRRRRAGRRADRRVADRLGGFSLGGNIVLNSWANGATWRRLCRTGGGRGAARGVDGERRVDAYMVQHAVATGIFVRLIWSDLKGDVASARRAAAISLGCRSRSSTSTTIHGAIRGSAMPRTTTAAAARALAQHRVPTHYPCVARRSTGADCSVVRARYLRQRVFITDHGGHLGFYGKCNGDPTPRWMDARVVEWLTQRAVLPKIPSRHAGGTASTARQMHRCEHE